jgi:hypothetical protein
MSSMRPSADAAENNLSGEASKVVDLLAIDFLSLGRYSPDGIEQALRDWVRNQNIIFLNGVSLKEIVNDLKKANLRARLIEYRDHGDGNQVNRLSLLKLLLVELREKLKHDLAAARNPPDIERFTSILANTIDSSEVIDFSDDTLLSRAIPLLHAELALDDILYDLHNLPDLKGHPAFESLAEVMRVAGQYFIAENVNSQAVLINIWHNYLLQNIALEADKLAYIDQLTQFAHQGGFMFSSLTQHTEYLSYKKATPDSMPTYAINGAECVNNTKILFSTQNNILQIDEETPINRIADNENVEFIENNDRTPIIITATKHSISVKPGGGSALVLESAIDTVKHQNAMLVVMQAFLEHKSILVNYANRYLAYGHSKKDIDDIMALYPKIKEKVPVKMLSFIDRNLKKDQEMHQDGDRILVYVGMSFPGFVDGLLSKIAQYDQDAFVKAIKLLRRMNKSELAVQVILPYILDLGVGSTKVNMEAAREQARIVVENEAEIEKAYFYLNQHNMLSTVASPKAKSQGEQKLNSSEMKLLGYIGEYIESGHNKDKITELLELYPEIKFINPVLKISFVGKIRPKNVTYENGDKVLLYIGKNFTDYPKAISNGVMYYDRTRFVNAVKILRRMGRMDLAIDAVMPYLVKKSNAEEKNVPTADDLKRQAVKIVEDETKLLLVYDEIEKSKSQALSVHSVSMKGTEKK